MMTQWNYSMAGPAGLRYEALPTIFRLRGVPREDWAGLFDQIRVMESEALRAMRKHG